MSKYIDDQVKVDSYGDEFDSQVSDTEESDFDEPRHVDRSKLAKKALLEELEEEAMRLKLRRQDAKRAREVIELSDSESEAEMQPPAKKKPPKRIMCRKKFGFTIPQSKNEPAIVIAGLLSRWPGVTYVVSREKHADGGIHYHGFVKADRPIAIYSNQIAGEVANFNEVWDEDGWKKYIAKDGEVWTNKKKETDIQDIKTKAELWTWAQAKVGKRAATDFPKIHETWRLLRHKERQEWKSRFAAASFVHNAAITQWVERSSREMETQERMKVLVVIGDSRLGKTEYLRFLLSNQPGGHCYFQNRMSAKLLHDVSGDCCFMVVDDMMPNKDQPGSKDCPPLKAWTQAHESVQTSKYCSEVRIPSRATVVLLNEEPNWLQDPYWKANTVVVRASGKFYR